MFFPFLRGGEMDILPFYEAARWMAGERIEANRGLLGGLTGNLSYGVPSVERFLNWRIEKGLAAWYDLNIVPV